MNKRADIDWARAAVLASLGAAGGWATNRFLLRNKSTTSQVLATILGGALTGGGSVAYDYYMDDDKANDEYRMRAKKLVDAGGDPMIELSKNTLGSAAILTGAGAMAGKVKKDIDKARGVISTPDAISGIDTNPPSTGHKVRSFLLGSPGSISQKSWDAATSSQKVNAMREILFGDADIVPTQAMRREVASLVDDNTFRQLTNDLTAARTEKTRLDNAVTRAEMAAKNHPRGKIYETQYAAAVEAAKKQDDTIKELADQLNAVQGFRHAANNAPPSLLSWLFSRSARNRATTAAQGSRLRGLRNVLTEGWRKSPRIAGSKLGFALSLVPIAVDVADKLSLQRSVDRD